MNAWEAIGEGEADVQVSLRVVNAAETSFLNIFPVDVFRGGGFTQMRGERVILFFLEKRRSMD
jgi:hypothetical protein